MKEQKMDKDGWAPGVKRAQKYGRKGLVIYLDDNVREALGGVKSGELLEFRVRKWRGDKK